MEYEMDKIRDKIAAVSKQLLHFANRQTHVDITLENTLKNLGLRGRKPSTVVSFTEPMCVYI